MSFRCVYSARECTGCMGCFDADDVEVPFDELPPEEEEVEEDE